MKNAVFSAVLLFVFLAIATAQESKPPQITKHNLIEMEALVEKGADPNAPIYHYWKPRKGETEPPPGTPGYYPLDAAIDSHQSALVKRILALGARVRGHELANAAFQSGHRTALRISEALLEAGADPNGPEDLEFVPPLNGAAFRGNLRLVELLLEQPGINVDRLDVDGRTPLASAAKNGHLGIVELLLHAGADPAHRSSRGLTAADEAIGEVENLTRLVATLQLAEGDPNAAVAAPDFPLGKWIVKFDNGVVQSCEIKRDGTAFVSEPHRSSPGTAKVAEDKSVMIAFEDDRTERWRPVGNKLVVEHWSPDNDRATGTPALGIAERAATVSR